MRLKKNDQRKALALLAGGLVLGVGAAVTLAAWNDSEFATGTFTAGQFNLQGSTTNADDASYDDHDTNAGAAEITFSASFDNLTPGDTVAAPFWVRLDGSTTSAATLTAQGVTTAGGSNNNDANLSYSVYALGASATCSTTPTGGTLVASGATLSAFAAGTSQPLTVGAGAAAGDPVQLCFVVTAGSALEQAKVSTATWQFEAVSN